MDVSEGKETLVKVVLKGLGIIPKICRDWVTNPWLHPYPEQTCLALGHFGALSWDLKLIGILGSNLRVLLEGWEQCPAWGQGFVVASAGSWVGRRNSGVPTGIIPGLCGKMGIVWGSRDSLRK